MVWGVPAASAGPPRVLPPGELPADTRLGPLKGERGEFPFIPPQSAAEWQTRKEQVRQVLRVVLGMWPMPARCPLNAVVHGKLDRGDYTVQKVYFESVPGFFLTGSLYRPKGREGKRPGVLSPHGHFPGGRFYDAGLDSVRRQIAQGAERFEEGGRSFMQSRCVQMARMGCVVFHYDMIGYGDCGQIPLEVMHRFSQLRVNFKEPPAAGLYSPQAELHLVNPMGLHTYNSIRALDFLTSLADVDRERIAVTGASGGGTQTFMLCAVDERPLVAVPVVILSTIRQGGCTCENVSGLRIGTYNLDFTALHAPKPLLIISAGDNTRTFGEDGSPELTQLYALLGAAERYSHVGLLQFGHNYNYASRTVMYHWLNRHLGLGLDEPILEGPYQRLSETEMAVWDENHPRPPGGPDFERDLVDRLAQEGRRQIGALIPREAASLEGYRDVVGRAWDILIRRRLSDFEEGMGPDGPQRGAGARLEPVRSIDHGEYRETLGLLRYQSVEDHRAELPLVRLAPGKPGPRVVVWIDEAGKSGLYQADGTPTKAVRRLLAAGTTVIGADLLYQGEFLSDGRPITRAPCLPGEEAFAGWTYCYNMPLVARRVHDILAVVAWARSSAPPVHQVDLVGLGRAGPWVAMAAAQARGAVARAAVGTSGFRFAELSDVYDADFLPGAAKYGDLPGVLALSAPTRLWLAGEGVDAPPVVAAAYRAAGAEDRLTIYSGSPSEMTEAAIRWLLDG